MKLSFSIFREEPNVITKYVYYNHQDCLLGMYSSKSRLNGAHLYVLYAIKSVLIYDILMNYWPPKYPSCPSVHIINAPNLNKIISDIQKSSETFQTGNYIGSLLLISLTCRVGGKKKKEGNLGDAYLTLLTSVLVLKQKMTQSKSRVFSLAYPLQYENYE